jgi:heme-degrading monooxygenase HmoA
MSQPYATIWEFAVKAAKQAEFERHYGPDGSWARLFRQSPGYIATELLNDRGDPLRYVTIDHWASAEQWQEFRSRFAEEYESLDRQCEELTTHEAPLGEYGPIEPR